MLPPDVPARLQLVLAFTQQAGPRTRMGDAHRGAWEVQGYYPGRCSQKVQQFCNQVKGSQALAPWSSSSHIPHIPCWEGAYLPSRAVGKTTIASN